MLRRKAMQRFWIGIVAWVLLFAFGLCMDYAHAQTTVYRCGSTYSDKPCGKADDVFQVTPQDNVLQAWPDSPVQSIAIVSSPYFIIPAPPVIPGYTPPSPHRLFAPDLQWRAAPRHFSSPYRHR